MAGSCPHCRSLSHTPTPETVFHRWWECPRWDHLRMPVLDQLPSPPSQMLTCLAECGILTWAPSRAVWTNFVSLIQKMMVDILIACCETLRIDGNVLASASETAQSTAIHAGLRCQIVRLDDGYWQCTVCKRKAGLLLQSAVALIWPCKAPHLLRMDVIRLCKLSYTKTGPKIGRVVMTLFGMVTVKGPSSAGCARVSGLMTSRIGRSRFSLHVTEVLPWSMIVAEISKPRSILSHPSIL